jgi:hypothetical protein
MRDALKRLGAKPVSLPGLPRVSLKWRRGVCRIGLSRDGVAVLRTTTGMSRKAAASAPVLAERALRATSPDATSDELVTAIASALDEAGCAGLPIHATFGDDLVRYFIVTPPPNGTRVQDLRTAAEVRFQMLYGESAAAWHLVADWHAATPFLACAVSLRLHAALQFAVRAQRSCLVSAAPNFIGAWNRWRRRVTGDAWLATLHDGALTLGLIDGAGSSSRLVAVRTLKLTEEAPTRAWLHDQLVRTALLNYVNIPKVLHVHGHFPQTWRQRPGVTPNSDVTLIDVRTCLANQATLLTQEGVYITRSPAAQLAFNSWGGASR